MPKPQSATLTENWRSDARNLTDEPVSPTLRSAVKSANLLPEDMKHQYTLYQHIRVTETLKAIAKADGISVQSIYRSMCQRYIDERMSEPDKKTSGKKSTKRVT